MFRRTLKPSQLSGYWLNALSVQWTLSTVDTVHFVALTAYRSLLTVWQFANSPLSRAFQDFQRSGYLPPKFLIRGVLVMPWKFQIETSVLFASHCEIRTVSLQFDPHASNRKPQRGSSVKMIGNREKLSQWAPECGLIPVEVAHWRASRPTNSRSSSLRSPYW